MNYDAFIPLPEDPVVPRVEAPAEEEETNEGVVDYSEFIPPVRQPGTAAPPPATPTLPTDASSVPALRISPPVKPVELGLDTVLKRAMKNALPSAINNIKDTVAILDPGFSGGDDVLSIGPWSPFPNVQRLARLLGELGIGIGTAGKVDTPMLDAVIDYYKNNYGLGPDGIEGFKRYIAEDPFGVVTDILSVWSLGVGAAAKLSKGASVAARATRVSQAAAKAGYVSKFQKFSKWTDNVNKAVNHGFSIPIPGAATQPNVALRAVRGIVRPGENANVARRAAARAGRWAWQVTEEADGTVKFRVGQAELLDPGALALGKTIGAGRWMVGKGIDRIKRPIEVEVDEDLVKIAEQQGITDLPLSARTGSKWLASAEAIVLNRDNPELVAQFEKVAAQLDAAATKIEQDIANAASPVEAGNIATAAYDSVRKWVLQKSGEMYRSIEGRLELDATLQNTYDTFDEILEKAGWTERLSEKVDLDGYLAEIYPNIKEFEEARRAELDATPSPDGEGGEEAFLPNFDPPPDAPDTPSPDTPSPDAPDTPSPDTPEIPTTSRYEDMQAAFWFPDVTTDVISRQIDKSKFRIGFGPKPNLREGKREAFQFVYKIMNLDDIIVSDLLSGRSNPDYDAKLQPREGRARNPDDVMKIEKRAAGLDVAGLVLDNPNIDVGAPIVNSRDMILSGNGRMLSIQKAYQAYPDQIQAYNAFMRSALESLGLTEADMAGIERPVIVRELLSDVDEVAFAQQANKSAANVMGAAAVAAQDAKILNDGLLDRFEYDGETDLFRALRSEKNRDFVLKFIEKVDESERAIFIDTKDGSLTTDGLVRIRRAILRETFQGVFGVRLINSMIELSNTEGLSNIFQALEKAMPKLVLSELAIRNGRRDVNFTIAEDLAQAIDKVISVREDSLKKKRKSSAALTAIVNWLNQPQMFGDAQYDLSPAALQLLPIIAAGVSKPALLSETLIRYANTLLGETEIPTFEEFTQNAWKDFQRAERKAKRTVKKADYLAGKLDTKPPTQRDYALAHGESSEAVGTAPDLLGGASATPVDKADIADKNMLLNDELARALPSQAVDLSALIDGFIATVRASDDTPARVPEPARTPEADTPETPDTETPDTETPDTEKAPLPEAPDEVGVTGKLIEDEPTPPEPLRLVKYKHLQGIYTQINKMLYAKDRAGIIDVNRAQLERIASALERDMDETLIMHQPELAPLVRKTREFWREWKERINTGWGKKLLKALGKPGIPDSGNPDEVSKVLFNDLKNKRMSTEQIKGFYQLIGGFDSDSGKMMRALLVRELLENSRTAKEPLTRKGKKSRIDADQTWNPLALQRQLNGFYREHLTEFLGSETVNKLEDLSDILVAFQPFAKKAHNSQTAFLLDAMEAGRFSEKLSETIERIGWALFSAVGGAAGGAAFGGREAMLIGSTAASALTAWLGPRGLATVLNTEWGRNWIMYGIDPGKIFADRFKRTSATLDWAAERKPSRSVTSKLTKLVTRPREEPERARARRIKAAAEKGRPKSGRPNRTTRVR